MTRARGSALRDLRQRSWRRRPLRAHVERVRRSLPGDRGLELAPLRGTSSRSRLIMGDQRGDAPGPSVPGTKSRLPHFSSHAARLSGREPRVDMAYGPSDRPQQPRPVAGPRVRARRPGCARGPRARARASHAAPCTPPVDQRGRLREHAAGRRSEHVGDRRGRRPVDPGLRDVDERQQGRDDRLQDQVRDGELPHRHPAARLLRRRRRAHDRAGPRPTGTATQPAAARRSRRPG